MAKKFTDINEALSDIADNFADVRGEALASRILAVYALDVLIENAADKQQVLEIIQERSLGSLEKTTADTEGDDELFERQIANARKRLEQTFEALRKKHGL